MTLETVVQFKGFFVAAWFAALFTMERVRPAAPPPVARIRLVVNGALGAVVLLISPLIVLPLTAYASDHALWNRPEATPGWMTLIVDIVVLDFWTYWLHRAYHEIPLMWRLHAPHHLDGHLDTTTALRFHAGEVALSAILRMGPILLLAMPFGHVVIFETLLLAASVFHHSNLRLPSSIEATLSRLVVTPSIHWVHHHADRRDTNSNYATLFSLWDRAFGTRSRTRRRPDMKIGLEGLQDRPLFLLLLAPFKEPLR